MRVSSWPGGGGGGGGGLPYEMDGMLVGNFEFNP